VARAASRSIGVADQTARSLPPALGRTLTHAADHAFVSAITRGFTVSTLVVALAFIVAATMVPRRMRTAQVEADDDASGVATPRSTDQPELHCA
jgi:hypothetical protein